MKEPSKEPAAGAAGLRARLDRLGAAKSPAPETGPASSLDGRLARELARLRVAVAEVEARRTRLVRECDPGWTLPEGEILETPHGPAWRLRRRYAPGHVHGAVALDACRASRGAFARVATADPRLSDFSPEGALYLDTETTGLAGGTGTVAFQIGVGRFDAGGGFVLDQYFLRDLDEEAAVLWALAREVEGAWAPGALVTFNGKCFDAPLLEARYRLQRQAPPWAALPHWDLLHVARRLWGRALADARLQTLEREVLGLARVGDIPGAEIPAVYTAYLREGAAPGLRAILDHNALDVLSMVALVGVLGRVLAGDEVPGDLPMPVGLAVGRLYERAGDARAARWFERARDRAETDAERWDAARAFAIWRKRRGDWDGAMDLWAAMRAMSGPRSAEPWEEAAKVLEHRRRRYAEALALAVEARDLGLPGGEGLARRIERLRRRAGGVERGRAVDRSRARP